MFGILSQFYHILHSACRSNTQSNFAAEALYLSHCTLDKIPGFIAVCARDGHDFFHNMSESDVSSSLFFLAILVFCEMK
jgi:hypothetical protein